jgi:hypothetical protein
MIYSSAARADSGFVSDRHAVRHLAFQNLLAVEFQFRTRFRPNFDLLRQTGFITSEVASASG